MEFPVKLDLTESANQLVGDVAHPIAKSVGETLNDLFFLATGGINLAADKKRIKTALNLELFERNCRAEIDSIPEEKLVEPDTQKVLNAIDDAKFCVDHEELRVMFEKLVASSFSSDTASYVHPSFSRMIRSFSVLDAKIISLFTSHQKSFPIVEYRVFMNGGGYLVALSNVFLPQVDNASFQDKSSSLLSLSAQGLLKLSYSEFFSLPGSYDPFLETDYYKSLAAETERFEDLKQLLPSEAQKLNIKKIDIGKGRADLTDLGRHFLISCGFNIKKSKIF